jgi:hypothetical protein
MGEAFAALTCLKVVLKVGIPLGNFFDRLQRFVTERRPTEVGVQKRTGDIDDLAQRGPGHQRDPCCDPFGNGLNVHVGQGCLLIKQLLAQVVNNLLGGFTNQHVGLVFLEFFEARRSQQPIDCRQSAQECAAIRHGSPPDVLRSRIYGSVSVLGRRGGVAHQDVDLAGGNSHDDPLDGADLFVCNLLFPGHAKVVFDSWLAFPGHGGSQPYHSCGASIEMLLVANRVVEIAVGFVLFMWQHYFMTL